MSLGIEAAGLVKRYGKVTALAGLDLQVPAGTVLALLGPNGAGKTTAVRVLTTLVTPDGGRARVAGIDVVADPVRVRSQIGVSGQYAAVDGYLTGFENLDMIGRLYHLGAARSRVRAHELLHRFGLDDAADRRVNGYSGGMRRRLDLAGALVARPPVLFLDEPTTGLDPQARLALWDVIDEMVADGTTLLLTTQYMEEADRLANHVAVVDHGRVIALGTPDEMKAWVGGDRLEMTLTRATDLEFVGSLLAPLAVGEIRIDRSARRVIVPVRGGPLVLAEGLGVLVGAEIPVLEIGMRRPTLDDVFLALVGRSADAADDIERISVGATPARGSVA